MCINKNRHTTMNKKIIFPNYLKILLCYFDIFGVRTEFWSNFTYLKIAGYLKIVHFLLGFLVTICVLKYLTRGINDPLGMMNDVTKHGGSIIVFWITLIEFSVKQSIRRNFWKIFQYIDHFYRSHERFTLRKYLVKFFFCLLAFSIAFVSYLQQIVLFTSTQYLYFYFAHLIASLVYLNRVFYYMFCLELIRHELYTVANEIKSVFCMRRTCVLGNEYEINKANNRRFMWIRKYFQSIYDMSNLLNHSFAWSNVIVILFSLQFVAADFIWIYWKIYNKHHVKPFSEFIYLFDAHNFYIHSQ